MVPRTQLTLMEQGKVGEGLVVDTTTVWRSRIDPMSKVRLFNKQHEPTDWLAANELFAGRGWLYAPATVEVVPYTHQVTMRGLDRATLDDLAATRPKLGTSLTIEEDGAAVVQARGEILDTWLADFIDTVSLRHVPREKHACIGRPGGLIECFYIHTPHMARVYMRLALACAPFGTWTFALDRHGELVAGGTQIFDRLENGLDTRKGWRWSDVAYAEVEDISGSKTLGAIIGTLALSAALAVVRGGGRVAARGGVPGARFGEVRAPNINIGSTTTYAPGTWRPELADDEGRAAPMLFGERARRRSIARLVLQTDLAVDAFGATQSFETATASVRLGQLVDFGIGGGHLAVRDGSKFWHGGLLFFRFGAHLPIDAPHRYAIPLSMDIGGGGGEPLGVMWRLRTGLQRRIGDNAFVGAAITPTFLNWKHGGPTENAKRWSLAAGLEAGWTY
jgi:hypothetical protein